MGGDEAGNLLVEGRGLKKRVEGNVHAIAPVVMRVGGDVDAFLFGRGVTQGVGEGEPVLQGEYAKERGAGKVAGNDMFAYLRCGFFRRGAPAVEDVSEIALGEVGVLLPPEAEGRHVVGAGGADAESGVRGYVAEGLPRGFGHALYLKGEYLQLLHDGRYALGHHTEVFAAGEEMGAVK